MAGELSPLNYDHRVIAWCSDHRSPGRPALVTAAAATGERFPLNFGREVLAELAGEPSRADWKACQASREEEAARCARFKAAFAPFDIMS